MLVLSVFVNEWCMLFASIGLILNTFIHFKVGVKTERDDIDERVHKAHTCLFVCSHTEISMRKRHTRLAGRTCTCLWDLLALVSSNALLNASWIA